MVSLAIVTSAIPFDAAGSYAFRGGKERQIQGHACLPELKSRHLSITNTIM